MRSAFYSLILLLVAVLPGLAQTAPAAKNEICVGGSPGAPIKIEVFSDYQCPACGAFYLRTVRSVLDNYASAGKVCVVYREFPLRMHQYAREAARYAHAARALGARRWRQVTDALYESQNQWAQDGNVEAVVAAALSQPDMDRVREWLADPGIDAAIARDVALARKRNVTVTPTFFITANGKTEKVSGVVQYPILRRYLDRLLGQ